jgi:hypothetical protein
MPLGGIRTWNPSKRAAVDPRLRPLGLIYVIYGYEVIFKNKYTAF